tara:strand:- start:238 stop:486 length:249 start_codon:yes stop_codon:yes gene_type:complete
MAIAEMKTGVIFLRTDTEEQIEPEVREIMRLVKKGRYRGPHFSCNGQARVYAVEVAGLRFRTDRDGNVEPFYLTFIKYRCNE